MLFLVGSDVLYGLNETSYVNRNGSAVTLTIPTDSGENWIFSFDDFPINSLGEQNVLLSNVSVKTSGNRTRIVKSKDSKSRVVYALLRVATCIPDDVFIDKKHSSHFKLIKELRYTTLEPDWGDHTASVYFVKITLNPNEYVHIYFSYKEADLLKHHCAFYCEDDGTLHFKDELKTIRPMNNEIISLSELSANK